MGCAVILCYLTFFITVPLFWFWYAPSPQGWGGGGVKKISFHVFFAFYAISNILWGPDLRNFLSFILDNDFYRLLRCRRCASHLLFWPWHFSDLSKRSRKTLIFQLNTFDRCHFVGPDLRNCLPFTLDDDFYRQLRCRRYASNLLYWPVTFFFDLSTMSQKTFIFQLKTLDGCHFVGTRSQKRFAIFFR